MRVEIPAYHDRWMMGDRCGEVVKTHTVRDGDVEFERAHVKLDKSGKVVRVNLDDCRVIDTVVIETTWSDWED